MAIQQIRRMRGGAQSHLMLASDGNLYVVKFSNNPQHVRVLANELLATRLATALGLAVPPCDVIEVTEWLIQNTPELNFEQRGGAVPCQAGLHFASRWVGGLMPGQTVDYLPQEQLLEVRNLAEFAGILALDKWTCNINGRQAVFQKARGSAATRPRLLTRDIVFMPGIGSSSTPAWAESLPKIPCTVRSPAGPASSPGLAVSRAFQRRRRGGLRRPYRRNGMEGI